MALEYVRDHLPGVDFDTLAPPQTSTVDGVTTVTWRPSIDGIPAGDHELRVNVAGDRVLNVLDSPGARRSTPTRRRRSTAGEAVRAVQDAVGVHPRAPRTKRAGGRDARDHLRRRHDRRARALRRRLAWRVTYRASSDRRLGRVRRRRSGKVLQAREPRQVRHDRERLGELPGRGLRRDARARRSRAAGWLAAGATQLLRAERARVLGRRRQRLSSTRARRSCRRSYTFTDPFCRGCGCSADSSARGRGPGRHGTTNRQQNAVQAFYFANRFHDHLAAAPIGFDAVRGASTTSDPLQLQTDDGAAHAARTTSTSTTRTCSRRRTARRR